MKKKIRGASFVAESLLFASICAMAQSVQPLENEQQSRFQGVANKSGGIIKPDEIEFKR
ncbi:MULTISPECIES: hypothetical protein [Burkholderia]|uniref:hypothetical protein n=1 Tax=Burkholderia TaxID=32008 RepID=UPI001C8A4419|nr:MULTISPECIES: hypothetical protein [Burkholderia]MCA8240161.1 hypothetical protein [Burkholderia sp. AU32262]